jgi:beta-galactosidase
MGGTHVYPDRRPDWNNLEVIHRNTLPPRSTFYLYDNVTDAKTRDVSKTKTMSLNGTWKFNLANSPFDAPTDFVADTSITSKWSDIEVPGHWQMQGYGRGPWYA